MDKNIKISNICSCKTAFINRHGIMFTIFILFVDRFPLLSTTPRRYILTRSASTRRRVGDGFNYRPNLLQGWKRKKKLYLLLLCLMRNVNNMSKGNALARNRCNLLPCTLRTSSQRLCKDVCNGLNPVP